MTSMGRSKEPEAPVSDPLEAKKHRDEATGHLKNGNYDRALHSLEKVMLLLLRLRSVGKLFTAGRASGVSV